MTQISTTVKNQELVEKRREQIVLAAIKLFSQRGFHKATLKDLATTAKLSYGNIYDYVGGKEDIIYLIHEYVYGLILDGLEKSTAQISDPIEKLRRMVRFEFSIMDKAADAILILYHYSHILKNEYLYKLLSAEREHLQRFEIVLEECISQGLIKPCIVRLNANLIKSMIDAWVLKRWDLRGNVTASDAANEILDMVLNGLIQKNELMDSMGKKEKHDLDGKTIFIANGGTIPGSAIISRLLAGNARLIVYAKTSLPNREYPVSFNNDPKIRIISSEEYGLLTPEGYERIAGEYDTIDVYVHDLGQGNTEYPPSDQDVLDAGMRFEEQLRAAQDLAQYFLKNASIRQPDRMIYVAPWRWDRYLNPIRFETALAGVIALTRELSRKSGPHGKKVNCIIPGFLKTPRPSPIESKLTSSIMEKISLKRLGKIDDLADTVAFFSAEASDYITGEVIHVTGAIDQNY
ncbi:MAG: SDR family oxidoreductase [Proteobacteria bacterium]|nr:SDR family oxidoreductase [Pseudomonadota bacterium]MBU4470151.1 SDR family oxidoreductase [Pseudomonadota bacterium]MCG2753134.1 SDR family oxidoreductase [Desulfobacteraceae bacterium]